MPGTINADGPVQTIFIEPFTYHCIVTKHTRFSSIHKRMTNEARVARFVVILLVVICVQELQVLLVYFMQLISVVFNMQIFNQVNQKKRVGKQ